MYSRRVYFARHETYGKVLLTVNEINVPLTQPLYTLESPEIGQVASVDTARVEAMLAAQFKPMKTYTPHKQQINLVVPLAEEDFLLEILRYLKDNEKAIGLSGDVNHGATQSKVIVNPQITQEILQHFAEAGSNISNFKEAAFQMFLSDQSVQALRAHLKIGPETNVSSPRLGQAPAVSPRTP
jgi:hypothetical protein